MEPALHGRRIRFHCEQCIRNGWFAEEIVSPSATCPWCGGEVIADAMLSAQKVFVEPIDERTELRRFDRVVVHDRETDTLEVKRLVGFPWENLRVIDGDLFVDGERLKKSLPQFLDQAVVVDYWAEASRNFDETVIVPVRYQSTSLWPRFGAERVSHPSPILDDYKMCPSESRPFVSVGDLGLRLELGAFPTESAELKIEMGVSANSRSVTISFSDSSWTVQGVTDSFHQPVIVMAFVDGRWMLGDDSKAGIINVPATEAADLSPEQPFAVSRLLGNVSVRRAFVLRDIHYRGIDGEADLELPGGIGYHLLGDNVSNSLDSRQRWPNGVPRPQIVGRVVSPRTIHEDFDLLSSSQIKK